MSIRVGAKFKGRNIYNKPVFDITITDIKHFKDEFHESEDVYVTFSSPYKRTQSRTSYTRSEVEHFIKKDLWIHQKPEVNLDDELFEL